MVPPVGPAPGILESCGAWVHGAAGCNMLIFLKCIFIHRIMIPGHIERYAFKNILILFGAKRRIKSVASGIPGVHIGMI
jgi:hypothetical protein